MVRIAFTASDGTVTVVDATEGLTLMEAARQNDIAGIAADCGGACACATCRVFIDPAWSRLVGPALEMEEAMLDLPPEETRHARLSCQITVTAALDGLTVSVPESPC